MDHHRLRVTVEAGPAQRCDGRATVGHMIRYIPRQAMLVSSGAQEVFKGLLAIACHVVIVSQIGKGGEIRIGIEACILAHQDIVPFGKTTEKPVNLRVG